MAEGLATGLAVEAAKAATKLVASRVFKGITLAWGFEDQLQRLQDKFCDIQAFLEDLGSAKYVEKSKFVNRWLNKFTDLAYSADELMDDYEYELLRRKIELKNNQPSFKKKCSNFFSTATNPAVFRIQMIHRVRDILSKFDELHKEAKNNGIQLGQLAREAVASTSVGYYVGSEALHKNRRYAQARGDNFIGRKSDEEKLLQMILNSSREEVDLLPTVAIVGIGGLGKTTLARRLYEHEIVNGHFDKKIWICVSEDFDVDRLLKEMVEYLTSAKCDLTNTGAITNKLQQELKGKKLFLVLDDVWESNQDSWESFKNALMNIGDLRESLIFITTRSIDVADKARALCQHKLPGLSEDEGWALLHQRVFGETPPHNSPFEDVGRRIVNKCKGVSLAIKAIGGILQSKKLAYDEWETIENNELWGFQPEDINDILPSLLLSYNHLNHVYVKQCFAYCAIFPKDFEIKKQQLITLWLAQGFLQGESATSSSTLTMEMIGEKYFNTLLNHSFLEEERDNMDRIQYKMHDIVHDLAAHVLGKDLLVWKVGNKLADVSHVRHLVFDFSKNKTPPDTCMMTRKLRTICFWKTVPSCWNQFTLDSARYMQTFIMTYTTASNIKLTEVPFEQLVHLRCLDLSGNDINELPESIYKLYQLQTLRIIGCHRLNKLPRGLYRLENLRHIEASHFLWASGGLRQLTNLKTLPPLELGGGEGWCIDELGPFDQLKGELKIRGLQCVKNKEAARQAGLWSKEKIVRLHLEWGTYRGNNDEDVLDSLEPHPNLQSLHIDGFLGVNFPSWMMAMVVKQGGHPTPLTNLKEVRLISCSNIQHFPTLGQLLSLRILWLKGFSGVTCIGEAFYDVNGTADEKVLFQSLTELHIISFKRMTTWMPPSPLMLVFPKIETLEIRDCPKLERVPCLQQFQSLKHLKLEYVGGSQPLDIIKCSPALQSLYVGKMENMMMIPQDCLSSLRELKVMDCQGLKTMPKSLEESTFLDSIKIENCPLIKGPIPNIGRLHGLKALTLLNSGELGTCCLQWIPNLYRLEELEIGGGSRDEWDFNLTFPQSLRYLTLKDFPKVESLPQQFLPSTLLYLLLCRFDELEQVPEWIGNLSSLKTLNIWDCKKLKYLPSQQSLSCLSRLSELSIQGCPILKQRCAKFVGPEWHKVSHIEHALFI